MRKKIVVFGWTKTFREFHEYLNKKIFSKSDFSGFTNFSPDVDCPECTISSLALTPNKILMLRILILSSELSANVYELLSFSMHAIGIIYEAKAASIGFALNDSQLALRTCSERR